MKKKKNNDKFITDRRSVNFLRCTVYSVHCKMMMFASMLLYHILRQSSMYFPKEKIQHFDVVHKFTILEHIQRCNLPLIYYYQ